MDNDKNSIFRKYLEIIEESYSKREAGTARKTGSVSFEELQNKSNDVKLSKILKDVKDGKIYDIPSLLGELYSGGKEEALKQLRKYNPSFLSEKDLEEYNIPLFNIYDKIEATKPFIKFANNKSEKDFFKKVYSVLSKIYEDNVGKKIDDIDLSDSADARTFKTRRQTEGGRELLMRARVGGSSKSNHGDEYVHITNTREDSPRLKKYKKDFGFDVRESEKPKVSDEDERKFRQMEERKFMLQQIKKGITGDDLKRSLAEYRAKISQENSNKPPKKTTKKKVTKESYLPFIRLIPF